MKTRLSVLVILVWGLGGCMPMMMASTPPATVESIQTGELVPKGMREHCPDIVRSCRTTAANEVQKTTAGQLSRFRGNQEGFDQQFIACVRDHEKDCDQKDQIDTLKKEGTGTLSHKKRGIRRQK
jgi:hypothetical protein